jgi:hypothetical protein
MYQGNMIESLMEIVAKAEDNVSKPPVLDAVPMYPTRLLLDTLYLQPRTLRARVA